MQVINDEDFLKPYLEKLKQDLYQDPNSILQIEIDYLDISGQDKDERGAFVKCFDKLKTNIYKKYNNFIVSLEPVDVIKLDEGSSLKLKKTNILLPHKKLSWNIELRIVYKVKYIKEV